VPAVCARARVVAVPYLVGFQSGIVHLAMTMGRAVVASDVGDIGSAVADGETGLLVPPGEPAALADALERIVSDPKLAERLGAEGRRRVLSGSSWESVAERLEGELREVA
jgi:glycosyltransferase involved in cell wall biosynthesis